MAEKWTNTSSPFSRWMKPNPLPALNHFTVPVSFIPYLFNCSDLIPDVSIEGYNRGEDLCSGFKRRERIQDRYHSSTSGRAASQLFQSGFSVQVDIALGRCQVGILFGALEELVELLFQNLAVALFGLEVFLEELLAPRSFAFEFGDLGRQIFNRGRLHRDGVRDHGAGIRVNLQDRLATGAFHIEHAFGHRTIVIEIGVSV